MIIRYLIDLYVGSAAPHVFMTSRACELARNPNLKKHK